ncbi:MAG: M48 family metallopeptidase [Opitutales bacterium]
MDLFLIVLALLLAAKVACECLLSALNRRHVRANATAVPAAFADVIDADTYRKSVEYTLARSRFGTLQDCFSGVFLGLILFSGWLPGFVGVLPWLYDALSGLFSANPYGIWAQAVVLFAVGMLLSLPGLPFEYYSQFRLEARFGFNRMTLQLWLSDKLKGTAIAALIGIPLLALLLWFFNLLPQTWWLWGFLALFTFQLLMLVLYPRLILPLFNKLSPLPEGELRNRLLELANRTGFNAQTIQVIDGSKRSTHSNAFFTGFGRFRRIVLYDVLIEQLEQRELEAVLAHEIGHYKLGHIPKMLVVGAGFSLLGFAILGWLAAQPWFIGAFGFDAQIAFLWVGGQPPSVAPALLLFSLLSGIVTFWFGPLGHFWSRKHEYEADAFARQAMQSPAPLITSLRKLHTKNLGNLTPHPAFSAFYYSHPTLVEREAALNGPA